MKKIITFLILFQSAFLFSQTVLATYPLEFKKSKDYRQILTAENTATHDFFVFAADKETLTILKYNSALFLSSQLSLPRPDINSKLLSGYSFDNAGNPTLYWSNENFTKIIAVQYDLNTKITAISDHDLKFFNQTVITTFQENNTFYIIAQKHFEEKLILYVFKNGKKEEHPLDFSSFKLFTAKSEPVTLSQILEVYPFEKIETSQFNPLYKGTKKSKIYVLRNRLLLTFDYNFKETQAFEIDLNSFEIQEKKYSHPSTQKQTGWSNSYYHENKIYQLNINEEELLFDIKDYQTSQVIKSYAVSKKDTITFKNSPLWIQSGGQKPKQLKNTAKFLQRLLFLDVGLTVYKTQKSILITLGGTNEGQTSYSNITSGLNAGMAGDFNDIAYDLFNNSGPTNVYFETVFDKKLELKKQVQEPLAVDFISGFTQEHSEVSSANIIRYKNYYILSYYDSYTKQITLRKFIDGYDWSF